MQLYTFNLNTKPAPKGRMAEDLPEEFFAPIYDDPEDEYEAVRSFIPRSHMIGLSDE